MKDLLEAYDLPDRGIAVVVRGGRSITAGHARPGVPFTVDTVSYCASVSKQMAGVCVALLGVDVETSVREWLPELPSWADGVRLRHLLHHTGGLPGDPELQEHMPFVWDSLSTRLPRVAVGWRRHR